MTRGWFVSAVLLIAAVALAGRLLQIQLADHSQLETRAIRQHGQVQVVPARMGDVLDVRGRPLAMSVRCASVFADPQAIPAERRAEVADSLALVLDLDAAALRDRLMQAERRRFLWIKRRVTDEEVLAVRDLKWPATWVGFQTEVRRGYPQGRIASHVVGMRDIDGAARDGIEKTFDELLRGVDGSRVSARDARGKTVTIQEHLTRAPQPGASIVLTIDSAIQTFAEEALDRAFAEWKPLSACAIVMNPHTGELLALANRPALDLELPGAAPPDAWVNRAISDIYEPGSTFKPFIVAAALDWAIVRPDDRIDCRNGVYRMGPRLLHSHHRNGVLALPDIVVKSDNIGMAIIGERMTNAGLYRAVQSFGFGRPTGIELPGESSGTVRPLNRWTPFYSTGSVPMGQELSVTPLQLVTAFSSLANGGQLLRPRIVRAIVGPDGKSLQVFDEPEVMARPVTPETAQYMVQEVLTQVVDRGTGHRARLAGYSVFGKTGTAQKQSSRGGYERGRYISSFIAGAPAGDPQLVAFVLLNDPSKGPEPFGGKVAAPATAEILERSLVYLGIAHDRDLALRPRTSSVLRYTD